MEEAAAAGAPITRHATAAVEEAGEANPSTHKMKPPVSQCTAAQETGVSCKARCSKLTETSMVSTNS